MRPRHVVLGLAAVALVISGCGRSKRGSAGPTVGSSSTVASSNTSASVRSPSTTRGASTSTAPRPCPTSSLSATLSEPNGAAGTSYRRLLFTNTSSQACTLDGYPGASFTDESGRQIGAPVPHSSGFSGAVTLAPHGMAGAVFALHTAYVETSPDCVPVTAATLDVIPPDQTAAIRIPDTDRVCSNLTMDGSASITAVTDLAHLPS